MKLDAIFKVNERLKSKDFRQVHRIGLHLGISGECAAGHFYAESEKIRVYLLEVAFGGKFSN